MLNKKTIREVELKGKRVLVRVDFNVPQDKSGNITDDKRIREALDTIHFISDMGGKVILASHLGRPAGERNMQFTLAPVARRLQELLDRHIAFASDCIGKPTESVISKMKDGDIILLENVRFYKEEEKNDEGFAKKLASLADVYVNDAFGAAHRAHASTEGVAKFLPSACGFLMEKELKIMGEAISNPKRPLTVILGGAKIADKIGVIDNLLKLADNILIGGGMAFTFIKAMGGSIGKSLLDAENLEYCKNVLTTAKAKGVKIYIPEDAVSFDAFEEGAKSVICDSGKIKDGWMGVDLGPKAIKAFNSVVAKSGTIIWNGPVGVFEFSTASKGTIEVAKAVASSKAISIIGGGDTAYAMAKFGFDTKFTHVSTGGGASLELLEGKQLPGVVALSDK
ncbi:MAG: phosphoglycerate kinase [Firmicutes bacterium]|nr:phosphoglycerate kinase [Bacillota bacterium]